MEDLKEKIECYFKNIYTHLPDSHLEECDRLSYLDTIDPPVIESSKLSKINLIESELSADFFLMFEKRQTHYLPDFWGNIVLYNGNHYLTALVTKSKSRYNQITRHGLLKGEGKLFNRIQWELGHVPAVGNFLLFVVNRDTLESDILVIEQDKNVFNRLIERDEYNNETVSRETLPTKLSENPDFYKCNWCSRKSFCHHSVLPPPRCNNCDNCNLKPYERYLLIDCSTQKTEEEQHNCRSHVYNPAFLEDHYLIEKVYQKVEIEPGVVKVKKVIKYESFCNGVNVRSNDLAVLTSSEIHHFTTIGQLEEAIKFNTKALNLNGGDW